jgi:hypothetical protein
VQHHFVQGGAPNTGHPAQIASVNQHRDGALHGAGVQVAGLGERFHAGKDIPTQPIGEGAKGSQHADLRIRQVVVCHRSGRDNAQIRHLAGVEG